MCKKTNTCTHKKRKCVTKFKKNSIGIKGRKWKTCTKDGTKTIQSNNKYDKNQQQKPKWKPKATDKEKIQQTKVKIKYKTEVSNKDTLTQSANTYR